MMRDSTNTIEAVRKTLEDLKWPRVSNHPDDDHVVADLLEVFDIRAPQWYQKRQKYERDHLFAKIRKAHNEVGGLFRGSITLNGRTEPAWYAMTQAGKILRHVDKL